MNIRARGWINFFVAVLSLTGFILLCYIGIIGIKSVVHESSNYDFANDNMSTEAIKKIKTKGLTFENGWELQITSINPKDIYKDLVDQAADAGINIDQSKIFWIDKNIVHFQTNGEYLKVLFSKFTSVASMAMWIITLSIIGVAWISGIITSILVKDARKFIDINGGKTDIVFSIIKFTTIPFLITAIITAIKLQTSGYIYNNKKGDA